VKPENVIPFFVKWLKKTAAKEEKFTASQKRPTCKG
jgi:hypothetical protein